MGQITKNCERNEETETVVIKMSASLSSRGLWTWTSNLTRKESANVRICILPHHRWGGARWKSSSFSWAVIQTSKKKRSPQIPGRKKMRQNCKNSESQLTVTRDVIEYRRSSLVIAFSLLFLQFLFSTSFSSTTTCNWIYSEFLGKFFYDFISVFLFRGKY